MFFFWAFDFVFTFYSAIFFCIVGFLLNSPKFRIVNKYLFFYFIFLILTSPTSRHVANGQFFSCCSFRFMLKPDRSVLFFLISESLKGRHVTNDLFFSCCLFSIYVQARSIGIVFVFVFFFASDSIENNVFDVHSRVNINSVEINVSTDANQYFFKSLKIHTFERNKWK